MVKDIKSNALCNLNLTQLLCKVERASEKMIFKHALRNCRKISDAICYRKNRTDQDASVILLQFLNVHIRK